MKKIIFSLIGVLFLALILITAMSHNRRSNQPQISGPQVALKGQKFSVEVVSTPEKLSLGLGQRDSLCSTCGMLFEFGTKGIRSFWMKDMLLPLDMVFFDNNWKIVLVEQNLQSSSFPQTFGSSVKSQYVLEINAGEAATYGLQVGNQAIFLNRGKNHNRFRLTLPLTRKMGPRSD